jgi:hypothetical protein
MVKKKVGGMATLPYWQIGICGSAVVDNAQQPASQ